MRHFLTLRDFSKDEILEIISLAVKIKKEAKSGEFKPYLKDKVLGMIFEKSSTRTRVSFEVGIHQLGGKGLFLSTDDIQLGRGEPLKDTARVLSRMVDMVMIRTFGQERLEEFAKYSTVPLISGLSDTYHPMQLLADYMTICEHGKNKDLIVAYVGDGNNIANSWLMLASKIGFELRISTPKGYEPNQDVLKNAYEFAKKSGAKILMCQKPQEAVKNADVVTTDTWVSMGQESEKKRRVKDFEGFMVDDTIMALAQKDAMFLHCLPAYRGYEVSDEVFEAHEKEIFDEAENRLHAQKAVMVWLDKQRKN
ncbi:MAG: ornithine carbamoyltransferase [Campylobacteraceae bacterium]|jgi:ornithine carbamoyltransferase|nr:ornithine carbamoyltransferase [Campylobacteraceae bacterium]